MTEQSKELQRKQRKAERNILKKTMRIVKDEVLVTLSPEKFDILAKKVNNADSN